MLLFEINNLYKELTNICDKIISQDVWDNSNNVALHIFSLLKTYKRVVYRDGETGTMYERQLNAISKFEYVYYRLLYNDQLYAASDWIEYTINSYFNRKNKFINSGISTDNVFAFIDFLLNPNNIINFKTDIAKIINAKITPKALSDLYLTFKIKTNGVPNNKIDKPGNAHYVNESFYNPFDDDLLSDDIENFYTKSSDEKLKDENTKKIKKIKPYDNKSRLGNIIFKDDKVFANRNFFNGDIIEVVPVRILSDSDLYSPGVRKIVFPIDLSKRIFGVPFGLSSIARNEIEANIKGNVDYEYDPNKSNNITVKAISKIKKGDEIIFVPINKMQYDKNLSPEHIHPNEIIKVSSITSKID